MPVFAVALNNNIKVGSKQKENIATVKDDEFSLNPTTNSDFIEHNPKNEKDGDWKYRISNDIYNKYNNYIIDDYDAFKVFIGIVNSDNCESSQDYNSFEGKTVYLKGNVKCGKDEISIGKCWGGNDKIFKGNFNGMGYTISNFVCKNYTELYDGIFPVDWNQYYFYGLFTYLSGTLENLRICDFDVYGEYAISPSSSPGDMGNYRYTGTLVGYAASSATIRNCAIENVRLYIDNSDYYATYKSYSYIDYVFEPICANGVKDEIVTKNCYLNFKNISINIQKDTFKNVYPLANSNSTIDLVIDEFSILNNVIKRFITGVKTIRDSINTKDTTVPVNAQNCIIKVDGFEFYSKDNHNTSKKYGESDDAKDWLGITNSSEGGDTDDVANYWYNGGEDYKDGWLYPRQFITKGVGWKKVEFTLKHATASPASILIPEDANQTYLPKAGDKSKLTIYNQNIEGEPESDCYGIVSADDGWTCNSVTSYTLKYTQYTRNVVIKMQDKEIKMISVLCGETITAQKSSHKEIKIAGETFTAPSGYYIKNADSIVSTCTSAIHSDKTLNIEVGLKKYNINIS